MRAARGAVNMSLDKFADAIGMGRSTLVRIENGSRTPERHEYERMAEVSGLPLGFFVTDDLTGVLDGYDVPGLQDRVATLEDQITELATGLAAVAADSVRHTRELEELRGRDRREGHQEEGG